MGEIAKNDGMWETLKVSVHATDTAPFNNAVDYCIGTGRMGLALQKEYMKQLALAQEEIGFKHIRGHGLFHDDMAIYQERERDGVTTIEYNFTYLDMVMDDYLALGIVPFIELGFMPKKLASGEQTIFYWKGNTTPPRDYKEWNKLVQATLRHLLERYGEQVKSWPVEVWNEPNLPGFWYKADREEYCHLFEETFYAVKEVDPAFRVGGPAICGDGSGEWMQAFLEFADRKEIPLDFITRHHYNTELPVPDGHYGYAQLADEAEAYNTLLKDREIIDSFPRYKGLEMHITEFNTSYIPNCPVHDTNQNAAFLARQLSILGDVAASYSYWTFGDIFEEGGVPFTPFHGGFGLIANGCIPKPTFWTFAFFKRLKEGICVHKDDSCVIIRTKNGEYRGVAWNMTYQRSGKHKNLELSLDVAKPGRYMISTEEVTEEKCNPLKLWHDMGEPANPSKEQVKLLQREANPYISSQAVSVEDTVNMSLALPENAVIYFTVKEAPLTPDRGYHYDYVMEYKNINPLTQTDYPDTDVIRVDDTYYMVSTTMYFMPGCEILRSYDLLHWEHCTYVYDRLDSTPGQCLEDGKGVYGKGMWAASLRYHKGTFYVAFVANDTQKTYLYTTKDINGPWEKHNIEGFYHDCSLLFDDDDKVYIAYGNRQIYITELNESLTGPKEGGLHRLAVQDTKEALLGYEGTHFYKINGKYYLFFIHSREDRWMRREACFVADTIDGEFVGKTVCEDDRGYCGQGVAQGGIVDTPTGKWYAILFQDSGAVGRIPVLLPVTWKEGEDFPVFGRDGKVPEFFKIEDNKPGYAYSPLVGSDDFTQALRPWWQYNHEPDEAGVVWDTKEGSYSIITTTLCEKITQARNTLTMRMMYPGCAGEITLDGSKLAEGDYAGLAAFGSCYGFVGLTKRDGEWVLVMRANVAVDDKRKDFAEQEFALAKVAGPVVRLRVESDFTQMKDIAKFYYQDGTTWKQLGIDHKMYFRLDHFTGVRFGLFHYATKELGGVAKFTDFQYLQ